MRKLGVLVALTTAAAVVGIAPAVAQTTPEVTAFCDAGLKVDRALNKVFSARKPSSKVKQEADQALAQAESVAPPEIAATVQSVVATIRNGIQSGQSPDELFQDEALQQSTGAIDQYRYSSCGYTQVDVTGIEYEFQGVPKTLPAGNVAFKFTDNGAEIHELDVFRVKGKDSVKKIVGLSEKEQRKTVEEVGSTFATQGQTSYTIVDLSKPGRYGVVCHLPVGSTSEQAAEEAGKKHAKSHAQEGMYGEITVEKGSTTSSATSPP
jgi:hypothetical protein